MGDFSDAFNRFLGGHNDAPQVGTTLMTPGVSGGSAQWTEADYQNALNIYNSMTPEQRYASGLTAPPPAPELNPGIANVNLQRGAVNPYIASLSAAAAGKGPSQAQNMLREGTATNVATQYGMAATPSVGGAAQAALVQNAQNRAGEAMQQGARQAAQLRAQEMTDARSQLGTALNQQQNTNLQAVGLGTEREKANQQAQIGAGGINAQEGEQNRGGIANIWHQALSSDIRAKEDIRPMQSFSSTLGTAAMSPMGIPQQTNPFDYHNYMSQPEQGPAPAAKNDDGGGFFSKLFSDERSKDHIRALEGALAESRRTAEAIGGTAVPYPSLGGATPSGAAGPPTARFPDLNPPTARFADLATAAGSRQALGPVHDYEYRYKPDFAAAVGEDTAPRAGIMAQELEQSPNPALRSAVINTPMGKAIEPKRALSANLAMSAGLDKRLSRIEQAISGTQVPYPTVGAR